MPPVHLLLIALLSVLSMSAVPVLIKSTAANEVTIGLARLVIAVAVFLPIFWRSAKRRDTLSGKEWRMLLIIGVVFGIHWITYFVSIKQATAAIAAMAIATYGIQYLVLARIFNGERFSFAEWLAVLLCFVGCVVIIPELTFDNRVTRGILFGVFSGFAYALLPLLHQRCRHLDTNLRAGGQFFFALLVFLPLLPWANWQLSTLDIGKLLVLGVLCTAIGHGLWVKASTELPAIYTSMMYYLYVPIALVSSVLLLDETLTVNKIVGAVLILTASLGVTLLRYRRLKIRGLSQKL